MKRLREFIYWHKVEISRQSYHKFQYHFTSLSCRIKVVRCCPLLHKFRKMLPNQFQTYFMDSATQSEGLYVCMSYVRLEVRRELLSYFCRNVTFRAHKPAHRSMGLVHLNWVRLGPEFQAVVRFWLLYRLLILLGPAAIQILLFIGQMTGIQESQWKQVIHWSFQSWTLPLSLTHTTHRQVARPSSTRRQLDSDSKSHVTSHGYIELYYI